MTDPVLHAMAIMVLIIDLLLLLGALGVSYVLIRYRREIAALYDYIKLMHKRRASLPA